MTMLKHYMLSEALAHNCASYVTLSYLSSCGNEICNEREIIGRCLLAILVEEREVMSNVRRWIETRTPPR
jgi:hypothetical protein